MPSHRPLGLSSTWLISSERSLKVWSHEMALKRHCQASQGFAQTPTVGMECLTVVSCASGSSSWPSWQKAHSLLQLVIPA